MQWSTVLVSTLLLVCLAAAPLSAAGDTAYDVDIDGSVDVPDRTISTKWGDKTIDEIGSASLDGTVSASTDGPTNESYSIRLIDSEQRLRASKNVDGGGSASYDFDLDRYDAGTYAIAATNDSDEVYAVEPFVINGYTVDQTAASKVEEQRALDVEINLTEESDDVDNPPAEVEVALTNGSAIVRTVATKESGLNYTASVDVESLSTGDYELYTGVKSDNEVYGEQELIAISDSVTVSVVEEGSLPDDDNSSDDGSSSGDGSSDPTETTTTSAPNGTNTTSTPDNSTTTTPGDSNATATPEQTTTTEPNTTVTTTQTTTATTTASNQTSATSPNSPTTATEVPVWSSGGMLLLGAVFALGLAALRRR
ncbi:hypothetical protein ACH9L7_15860 [Haloferax sp. S1W]|uniref:hypothetical protein n=1 Tax=Haloferax sp. S1W TaxID=3377110 RepID=UPI0037C778AA